MTAELSEQAKALLDGPTYVTLTTIAKDGSPHSTLMWAEREGDVIVFSTVVGRAKELHLRHNDKVGVSFFDPQNPFAAVSVRGTAAVTREGGPELIQKLAQKYTGGPYTYDDGTDNVRVVVRVTPGRVFG
ncbi:MAG: PPOX class F420-dependent oxidoreductase [Actinobacteria bacterium]|nr:PPOX class F420-dependent oxidoreductase [Actinomycetota bacterium]